MITKMKNYRICSKCKRSFPLTKEYFYKRGKGFRKECKGCFKELYQNKEKTKDFRLKRDYGISIDDYNSLLKAQNNRCAICGIENSKTKKDLDIDHDHKTGEIRGLLCNKCNILLGYCNENIFVLDNAIAYLLFFKKRL